MFKADGVTPLGQGTILADGNACTVVTNVHVGFGDGRDENGEIRLVDKAQRRTGYAVVFVYDLDPVSGRFKRKTRATVKEFGGYSPKRGGHPMMTQKTLNDIMVLRLDDCAGREFATVRYPGTGATYVEKGTVTSISVKSDWATGKHQIVAQACQLEPEQLVAGLLLSHCKTERGMSGSQMVYEDSPGSGVMIGIHSASTPEPVETRRAIAVSTQSNEFVTIVQSVIGVEATTLTTSKPR